MCKLLQWNLFYLSDINIRQKHTFSYSWKPNDCFIVNKDSHLYLLHKIKKDFSFAIHKYTTTTYSITKRYLNQFFPIISICDITKKLRTDMYRSRFKISSGSIYLSELQLMDLTWNNSNKNLSIKLNNFLFDVLKWEYMRIYIFKSGKKKEMIISLLVCLRLQIHKELTYIFILQYQEKY
jgi:hypothetical protein